MKKLSLLFVSVLSLVFFNTKAQVGAPTLQAGLNGISFSKGNLDAALIAEIIAEKQSELKNRLIKEMLLNSLGVDNGLFYAYIDNTIDIIVNEKNEETRARNLLENTVNLAFVMTYTEYYLYTLKEGSVQMQNLKKLAFAYGIDNDVIKPKMSLRDITRQHNNSETFYGKAAISDDTEKKQRNQFVGVLLDVVAEAVKDNKELKAIGLLRTSYLQNQKGANSYFMLSEDGVNEFDRFKNKTNRAGKKDFSGYYDVLEKLVNSNEYKQLQQTVLAGLKGNNYTPLQTESAAISKLYIQADSAYKKMLRTLTQKAATNEYYNDVLNAFNFNGSYKIKKFQNNGVDSLYIQEYGITPSTINAATNNTANYAAWSNFNKLLDINYKFSLFDQIFDKKQAANAIIGNVGSQLNLLLKYYGIVKTLATQGTNIDTVWKVLEKNYKCGNDSNHLFATIITTIDSARKSIINVNAIGKEDLAALTAVNSFIEKLRLVEANRYVYLAQYESEIKPALERLSKYSQQYIVLKDLMFQRLLCYATQAKGELQDLGINIGSPFISLLVNIDEFDEAATYQKYLNQLADAGDMFSNPKIQNSINKITTFVRSYIKVAEDSNNQFTVNIDAEGFITSLQKLNYNKFSPWGLNFTVGTNAVSFNRPLTLGDGSTINNYSFIGEKIGVKYKLYDNKYLKSFSRGETFKYWRYPWFPFFGKTTYIRNAPPREPILSNVHLLAYGSGILYNLVNTGTTKDFNSPLVGAGLGLAFYNGLDINFSLGTAIVSDKPILDKSIPFYFNIGMDIQFVEYIDRLNQKRKANRTQKKLAEATANAKD